VDATHEPDLFWAVRGGGGNFGVAVRFKYQLNDLPAFTGGMLCIPATAETIAGFVAAAEAAPNELSTIANVMPAPPMPFLPAEVHGKLVILGMIAYAGDDAAAEEAIAPFRALAKPYADFIKPGPYLSMYPPEDPDYHPTAVSKNMFMNRIGLAEAQQIVDTLTSATAVFRVTQIRVLGGAIADVAADADRARVAEADDEVLGRRRLGQLLGRDAGFGPHGLGCRVDVDALHVPQVDHDAALAA
jgi:hypothetical protein